MSNHFHVVARVPQLQPVSDAELLRRYRVLYPKPTARQAARLDVIVSQLAANGPDAVLWRQRQLRLMGDVSQFMKLVKQRFSIWFNKAHQRFGTLWSERFKSVLVGPGALQPMAAYVDLNCVRAGLVEDPKDYRFCGYAEAVAGNRTAQAGLRSVLGIAAWGVLQAQYRQLLFGTGGSSRAVAASLPLATVQRVIADGGKLPLATLLRCRLRYFTDGAVLGTRAFVAAHRRRAGPGETATTHTLPACSEWSDLATPRGLRRPAVA